MLWQSFNTRWEQAVKVQFAAFFKSKRCAFVDQRVHQEAYGLKGQCECCLNLSSVISLIPVVALEGAWEVDDSEWSLGRFICSHFWHHHTVKFCAGKDKCWSAC